MKSGGGSRASPKSKIMPPVASSLCNEKDDHDYLCMAGMNHDLMMEVNRDRAAVPELAGARV